MIRRAEERDAGGLARIYNQAMEPGVYATVDLAPVSRESRVAWLRRQHDPYGAWVYESGRDEIAGWCSLGPFPVRPAYPSISEVSVYVDACHRGRAGGSIGGALLAHLVGEARRRRFRSLVSLVFEKNAASISGCLMAGFRPMVVLREVASVGSGLENVVWVQKDLRQEDPPIIRDALRRIAALGPPDRGRLTRRAEP